MCHEHTYLILVSTRQSPVHDGRSGSLLRDRLALLRGSVTSCSVIFCLYIYVIYILYSLIQYVILIFLGVLCIESSSSLLGL